MVYVGPAGLTPGRITKLWDAIALTGLEAVVLEALAIVAPIERLALVAWDEVSHDRNPIVLSKEFATPVPLKSMGDGVNRIFGVITAMANTINSSFLVDEIENGIHYSALIDLWGAIFRLAAKLNIQVFATTHSSDCIAAFQIAASESVGEGVLIRLAHRGDSITASEFDEREMTIAVEGEMELR